LLGPSQRHPVIMSEPLVRRVASANAGSAKNIWDIAKALMRYDDDPTQIDIFPAFTTMCIGVDCEQADRHFSSLDGMGVGYFIVVMNARDARWQGHFNAYQQAFGERFIVKLPPRKLSCAESWNVILHATFDQLTIPLPFIVIINADFIVTNGRHKVWNAWMREQHNEKLLKFPIVEFHHFYAYAYTKLGWEIVGEFDENVFPAYGEDVEMVYRSASLGLYPFPEFPDWAAHNQHVGSMSLRDGEVSAQIGRFDRADFNMRKWNVHLYCCGGEWWKTNFQVHRPYAHPFNLPHVPHRHGWAFDPDHRRCVLTGQGQRVHNSVAMCWFNASRIFDKFPAPNANIKLAPKILGLAPA